MDAWEQEGQVRVVVGVEGNLHVGVAWPTEFTWNLIKEWGNLNMGKNWNQHPHLMEPWELYTLTSSDEVNPALFIFVLDLIDPWCAPTIQKLGRVSHWIKSTSEQQDDVSSAKHPHSKVIRPPPKRYFTDIISISWTPLPSARSQWRWWWKRFDNPVQTSTFVTD